MKFNESDFVGKKFHKLTILQFVGKNKWGWAIAKTRCDCGKTTNKIVSLIKKGRVKTCGCGYRKERDAKYIGRTFGWITILEIGATDKYSARQARVKCKCGEEKWLNFYGIRMGRTKSCGCRRRDQLGVAAGMYRCSRCKRELAPNEFTYKSQATNGRSGRCRDCDKDLKYQSRYGVGRAEKQRLLERQSGCCAICSKQINFTTAHLDHYDSDVGGRKVAIIRGLLCGGCNQGIGSLQHSKKILLSAIEYLGNQSRK